MHIDASDLKAVAGLWRELADFPAGQAREARTHCLARLAEIIGAQNVFWVAAVRDVRPAGDALAGWRPRAYTRLHINPDFDRRLDQIVRSMETDGSDPMTLANVRRAGATRTALRRELVSDEAWERAPMIHEVMRPGGIEDRMMGVHALDAAREAYLGFDRGKGERPFGDRERDLVQLFLLGAPDFHRGQFLSEGLFGPPLSPRERDVLALLLTDRGEREIGQALGLTWRTTHQYCVSIFRKFAVKGRVGLMAHFLRGDGPRRP
jgi:DNA-binding CsgD family transcriptional regulator